MIEIGERELKGILNFCPKTKCYFYRENNNESEWICHIETAITYKFDDTNVTIAEYTEEIPLSKFTYKLTDEQIEKLAEYVEYLELLDKQDEEYNKALEEYDKLPLWKKIFKSSPKYFKYVTA